MGLNPVSTTNEILQKYTKYLSSLFFLKDKELMDQAEKQLNISGKFVKGPFIEITPPFELGKCINDLIHDGIFNKEFEKIKNHFPLDRPLYLHQNEAINKIIKQNHNIVVATGTGSGKTECFKLPIINYLMTQKQHGKLTKGVRALFLYPMNALANDQIGRLRTILSNYPDITFGRFTGETEEEEEKASELFKKMNPELKRIPNEIISREEMRKNPPHILLTNYAMLEYLLLRPSDNVFFDGEYAKEWNFIVLDEAHTYTGAKGTEISMLIKRLKERICNNGEKHLRCIATSATLGGGKESFKDVANFAASLFNEPFFPEDIIKSKRINLSSDTEQIIFREASFYDSLNSLLVQGEIKSLYEKLKNDGNVRNLQKLLQNGSQLISDVAKNMFKSENISLYEKERALINIVNLCATARNNDNDFPLLPARYHVFVKSLEGAFVALYPNKKLYLDRHTEEKLKSGKIVPVFELANCQRCGQEYIVGTTEQGILRHVKTHVVVEGLTTDKTEFYMLSQECKVQEFDEDEFTFDQKNEEKTPNLEEYILCCGCGRIERYGDTTKMQCCTHSGEKFMKVYKVKTRESKVNSCYNCGSHSPDLVKRFLSADDPATEVLTKTLYQSIPQQKPIVSEVNESHFSDFFEDSYDEIASKNEALENETGRKLLVFSDNRQEAAFFATFLNLKYNQVLWRNAILNIMTELEGYEDIRMDSVAQRLLSYGKIKGLFSNTMDDPQKISMVYKYLMKEFIATDRQIGLEGLGIIGFTPKKPSRWGRLPEQNILGVDEQDMWKIYCVLFDTLRMNGSVTFPKDVSPTDEFFSPRNKFVYFKLEPQEKFKQSIVLGWLSKDKSSNRRLDFINKILLKNGYEKGEAKIKARVILKNLFSEKAFKFFSEESYIHKTTIPKEGVLHQLNYSMWNVIKSPSELYRCNICGNLTMNNIKGVCPTYRCEGELKKYNNEKTRFTYFKELYQGMKAIPMVAKEHTAQLTSDYASKLQVQFEKGEVNILSCSTTFEMGVDVGQLEAVFMRNVPPETANYIQRAGRAGRRTESTAFSLTYAKRRSHDLTYYQYPQDIISGKIQPPHIEIVNDKIIERHLYSVVFSWFFKKHGRFFGSVDNFFGYSKNQDNGIEILKNELASLPIELKASLETVIPPKLHKHFKIEEWGWVDRLLNEKNGALVIAKELLYEILKELTELENKLRIERKPSDSLLRIKNTYLSKSVLQFLSSYNILPKYGFPVDVVELNALHHGEEAKNISLSRDLRIAISEFAPGSEIVANGKVWKPYAINKTSTRGWPVCQYAICKLCKKIHKYEADLGIDIEDKVKDCCGAELNYFKYIKPVFGFSTNLDSPSDPGEKRSAKFYPTQVIFDAFVEEDNSLTDTFEKSVDIGNINISMQYSSRGRLVLLNQGFNKTGFKLCKNCGYITSDKQKNLEKHKTKTGNSCKNTYLHNVHFGHDFITDVLELKFPLFSRDYIAENFWLSFLYSIIEGASISLGISRNEINGCLYYNDENELNIPSIMLFDDVPGGAGHVKKISNNIYEVLNGARKKVSGTCGCGEETSCYGCLRNYGNQLYHDNLSRGLSLYYLNDALSKNKQNIDFVDIDQSVPEE